MDIDIHRGREIVNRAERDAGDVAAAFFSVAGTGMVNEDLSHEFGREPEKVTPVGDGGLRPFGQSDEDFVNESRGLERVGAAMIAEVRRGEAPQVGVNLGEQVAGGGAIPRREVREHVGHALVVEFEHRPHNT